MEVQSPGGRLLGEVNSPTAYRMDKSIGTDRAKNTEDQIFMNAASSIRSASQQYSDRPSIRTLMRPNLELKKRG